jgi:hypothetical protein
LGPHVTLGGVDDERYGRVTNPERYRILHGAASRSLADLELRYVVSRQTGAGLDTSLIDEPSTIAVERLLPEDPSAAPITIAFTDFPGVIVRFGRWHVEAFPACGCDACDESPERLVDLLVDELNAVAAGDFSETQTTYKFEGSGSGWAARAYDEEPDSQSLRPPPDTGWRPWPGRSS